MSRRSLSVLGAAAGLSAIVLVSPASAGCAGWGCQPVCGTPVLLGPIVYAPVIPCAALLRSLQPVYRVEQGPIHNIVVVPCQEPRLWFGYLPARFFAECGCYR